MNSPRHEHVENINTWMGRTNFKTMLSGERGKEWNESLMSLKPKSTSILVKCDNLCLEDLNPWVFFWGWSRSKGRTNSHIQSCVPIAFHTVVGPEGAVDTVTGFESWSWFTWLEWKVGRSGVGSVAWSLCYLGSSRRQAVSIWREVLCREPYLGGFLVEGGRVLTVWGGAGLWSKSGRKWIKIWEPWGKKGVWGRISEDLGHLCMHRKPRIIP